MIKQSLKKGYDKVIKKMTITQQYSQDRQYRVIEDAIKKLDNEVAMKKFSIDDKVEILIEIALKNGPQKNVKGVIEAIDGQHITVRPKYYKHFIKCYPTELRKL